MKHFIMAAILLVAAKAADASTTLFNPETYPQVHCLALNVYFESRSSNLADKAAVADVVINRVNDSRYPNTVCEVVHDGYKKGRRDCQFSWYCDGKAEVINDRKAWIKAQYIAYQMLYADRYRGITEGATHYHAHYVKPTWAEKIQYIDSIGSHKFYRYP